MAARHDCYADWSQYPFPEGHGYVDTVNQWRTIMAYEDECLELYRYNCPRIQYFSNPDRTYQGAPLGTTPTTPTTTTTTTAAPGGAGGGGGGGGCFLNDLFQ
jgi:hypothetical protein